MNYKLKVGDEIPDRIREILRKQIRRAAAVLADRVDDGDEPIHDARKWLKKVRAMLRLVKPALGEKAWQREDRRIRRIAKRLAQRRDAEVLDQTMKKLRRDHKESATRQALTKLRRSISVAQDALPTKLRGKERKSRKKLKEARRRVKELPLEKLGWRELSQGIEATYRAGAEALAAADRTRAPEALHEWRKRVKDLWYQLRVLQLVRRDELGRMAEDAKQLSLRLGDDHDLFMVKGAAKTAKLQRKDLKRIMGLVQEGRLELEEDALALGRRIYSESPEAFARRISASAEAC